MKTKISIFLICFFIGQNITGDTLFLSNGNSVKGSILFMDEDVVKIETGNGILEVKKDNIVRGEFFGSGEELSGDLVFEFLLDGRIKDSSGNSHIIKTRSIPYGKGVLNSDSGALDSDGLGRYFYIEKGRAINSVESFTIAMDFFPVNTSKNRFLISSWDKPSKSGKYQGRFSLSVMDENLMLFVVDSDGNFYSLGKKNVLNKKDWNTVAFSFDSGEIRLFVNGESVASNVIDSEKLMSGDWPIYFLTAKYVDSKGKTDFEEYNIVGRVDNIKMYNSALTDSELNSVYNRNYSKD